VQRGDLVPALPRIVVVSLHGQVVDDEEVES